MMHSTDRERLIQKVALQFVTARRPKKKKSKGQVSLNPSEILVWESMSQGGEKTVRNPDTDRDIMVKGLPDPKGRKHPIKLQSLKTFEKKWRGLDDKMKINMLKKTMEKVGSSHPVRVVRGNAKTKKMIKIEIEKLMQDGDGSKSGKKKSKPEKILKSLLGKLKLKTKGMRESLKAGGKGLAKFVTDKKFRDEQLSKTADALDKATPVLIKEFTKNLIGEATGYKSFYRDLKGLADGSVKMRLEDPDNPGKKMWNRDVLASMYGTGAYVAAGVGAALLIGSGGGAAGVVGAMGVTVASFTKSKIMHSMIRTVSSAVTDYAQDKAFDEVEKEYNSAKKGEKKDALKKEYLAAKKTRKEAKKLERILGGNSISDDEFNQLQEDYGDDPKFGKYLKDKGSFQGMPENRKVKTQNDLADIKKRMGREILDRVFLGAEWLEVFSGVGATFGKSDWFNKATGGMGTDWLGTAGAAVGDALVKVVVGSDHSGQYDPATEQREFEYRVLCASTDKGARKGVEEFVGRILASLSADMREGISDGEMKSILEADVKGFESGEMGSGVSKLLKKKSKKKEASSSDYYGDAFTAKSCDFLW